LGIERERLIIVRGISGIRSVDNPVRSVKHPFLLFWDEANCGLIQVEVPYRLAGVGRFLGFLDGFLGIFLQQVGACFWASTDWRKMDSRRLSCSFMARTASSMSAKVLGLTAAVCAITAFSAGSTFSTALQHGQVTSKAGAFFAISKMIPQNLLFMRPLA